MTHRPVGVVGSSVPANVPLRVVVNEVSGKEIEANGPAAEEFLARYCPAAA